MKNEGRFCLLGRLAGVRRCLCLAVWAIADGLVAADCRNSYLDIMEKAGTFPKEVTDVWRAGRRVWL